MSIGPMHWLAVVQSGKFTKGFLRAVIGSRVRKCHCSVCCSVMTPRVSSDLLAIDFSLAIIMSGRCSFGNGLPCRSTI